MLLERAPVGVTAAVGRLAGMQAQEPGPPYLGLWSRLEGFEPEHLDAAIEAREVVRATLMRGTLHLLPAADLARLHSAIAPSARLGMARVLGARIDGLDLDALLDAGRELFVPGPMRAFELRDALEERFPEADIRALAAMVRTHLALVRVPDGGRWGFTPRAPAIDAATWLGKPLRKRPDREELVRRYLAAFGPATVRDAQTWLGGGGLAEVFEKLRPEMTSFEDESGRELFDLPDAPRPAEDTPSPVRFLPDYDNLLLAYEDRSRVIADEHRPDLVTKNLRVRPTVLSDGTVAAFWSVEGKGLKQEVKVEPVRKLSATERKDIHAEAARVREFMRARR